MGELRSLRGLGPSSERALERIGITTTQELMALGAIETFRRLRADNQSVSVNFLYALVGAIEDTDWREIARERRYELLSECEALEMLEADALET